MGGTADAVLDAVQHLPNNVLWRLRRERTVSVGDAEATYYTGSLPEAAVIDNTFRTERAVARALVAELRADDVVWDVGANGGFYTCLVGGKLDAGEVVAFEPLERNVERLRRDLALSDVDARVEQVALGDDTATVTFDPPTFTNTFRGTSAIAPEANGDAVEVPMRRGDALIERGEVPAPTVLKIDVEGAEGLVLDGLADYLADRGPRAVFCEVHPDLVDAYGTGQRAVRDRLERCGYEIDVVESESRTRHLRARRPD